MIADLELLLVGVVNQLAFGDVLKVVNQRLAVSVAVPASIQQVPRQIFVVWHDEDFCVRRQVVLFAISLE